MSDAVGAADRLRSGVAGALAGVLAGSRAPPGRIHVGWWAALAAAACPAAYRAEGEAGWGVGVLGSTRMEYARVIALVDHMARSVALALKERRS